MRTKALFRVLTLCAAIGGATVAMAQDVPVDYSKYPDYSTFYNPDPSFYTYGSGPQVNLRKMKRAAGTRPDHLDNSQKMFFPPVFNQDGGSCGSASRICYMFTHELNAYRNLNGKDPNNYYPSHFVWLLTNGNSGKDAFVQFVGVPSAAIYGGQTYSSQFGNQVETDNNFGWMTGYDKWYAAMFNRMWQPSHIPNNVGTQEGREFLKNWLWNHNGDDDFYAGGIAGIGVASGGTWANIPQSETNSALGVVGKKYVKKWGTSVDHALTIVGYDDRIEFDLDENGIAGEKDKDEVGAWIIVNSWGSWWCNNGFIYCPYKHAVTAFTSAGQPNGSYYAPEIYRVRKDYKPERTIRLKMDYDRRSEIALSVGISTNLEATEPDQTIVMHHFQYAGDGHNGNSNPAPEIPMLGKWADGKLHTEPMEFGYDLTDLSASVDKDKPVKYFFIIKTKNWAQGTGHLYEASIIDYRHDANGLAVPFDCSMDTPVEIKSAGKTTTVSVVVYGNGFYPARNLAMSNGTMTWDAPRNSGRNVEKYNIYTDGAYTASTTSRTYSPAKPLTGKGYSVTAVYEGGAESEKVTVNAPVEKAAEQTVYSFKKSGFTIPGVFDKMYTDCTIEFLIRPNSVLDWNQNAGPGWGKFEMHANANGAITAGWDTSNRCTTTSGKLKKDTWTHVAVVITKNNLKIYVNGSVTTMVKSSTYSGIGGFGDFTFTASTSGNNYVDACMDEIRIWNCTRTSAQIAATANAEFSGEMLPDGLIAYYKGEKMAKDGKNYLVDVAGGHHAVVLTDDFETTTANAKTLTDPTEATSLKVNAATGEVLAGLPVEISAAASANIQRLVWNCPEAGLNNTAVMRPTVVFPAVGEYTVKATGYTYTGETIEAEGTFTAAASPDNLNADFTVSATLVPAGERVALNVTKPVDNNIYKWTLPGARYEEAGGVCTNVVYDEQGTYDITLTVSTPDGKTLSKTKSVTVSQVAPESDFRISPACIVKGDTTYLIDESRLGPTSWQWNITSLNQNYIVNGQNSSFAPKVPGVYDVELITENEAGQGTTAKSNALYVCNADSKNGLSMIGYPNAAVTAPNPLPANATAFTIGFWLEQSTMSDYCDGIGDESGTVLLKVSEGGALVLSVRGITVATFNDFIKTTGWHHYAVTYDASTGYAFFYRDGMQIKNASLSRTSIPTMARFRIGGSDLPLSGRIDEVRVWAKVLTMKEIREVCVAPIEDIATAEADMKLRLYYDFNQSGGDVEDRTSNGFHGVRTGFGPDGDAWGLSQGVFALSFDGTKSEDVTDKYLTNYKKSFAHSTTLVNTSVANRFYALTGWKMENQVKTSSVTTGAHVDAKKSYCLTSTAEWDGFADLNDHKVYQTVTLPAGTYKFTACYDDTYEGQCGDSYVVCAEGATIPVTDDIRSSLADTKMQPKFTTVQENKVTFSLEDETEVSLGLLINQNGKICMTIQEFKLERSNTIVKEADGLLPPAPTAVTDIKAVSRSSSAIYDLQGRRVSSPARGLYIIDGKKVVRE